MKCVKWKVLIVTCIVCLLPILFGLFLWDRLPDEMAIHFDMYNRPDNFAPKGFVVFGLPVLMVALQVFCCIVNDINAKKHGEREKFERATKWIIPVLTVILQIVTLEYGLGRPLDIRKIASVIVGCMLLLVGNYLPKFDYIKNYDITTEKARKINRFIGFLTVCMGLLFFISAFLPPKASIIALFLLIPYGIISAIYGIRVGRK